MCPNGCMLHAEKNEDGTVTVTGATCKRGVQFATNELTDPKRSITSTVATSFPGYPRIPVKTDGEIPKDKIFEAMKQINSVTVSKDVKTGDTIIEDLYGVKLRATSGMENIPSKRINEE